MVFSSIEFLCLFLPLFLLAQSALPHRNLTLVLFSLLFYFVGEGWYTAVIAVSVLVNYVFGRWIEDQPDWPRRRMLLAVSLALNVSLLVFFKYAGFLAQVVFAVGSESAWTRIHLPLGISFFTFHAISYLVDTYRGDARAERSLVNLSLYMLMFPQLIAGPILRFHTVAGQLRRRVVTTRHVYYGVVLFCLGLGQKVLIADTLASLADPLFARVNTLSPATAWLAAICYAFQIFFDFGGYSNMAIGLGWLTGFHYPRNFNYPYIARSVTEFWQRWHMSLSRWFRDYVYIPLGGNRLGPARTYRNLLVVFLLCGFWHGAAWPFLVWGAYYGILLIVERLGWARALDHLPRVVQHAYTMLAVIVGWVLFRTPGLGDAGEVLSRMFLLDRPVDEPVRALVTGEQITALVAALVFSLPLIPQLLRRWMVIPAMRPWPRQAPAWNYAFGIVSGLTLLTLSAVKIVTGAYSPFIYFRF